MHSLLHRKPPLPRTVSPSCSPARVSRCAQCPARSMRAPRRRGSRAARAQMISAAHAPSGAPPPQRAAGAKRYAAHRHRYVGSGAMARKMAACRERRAARHATRRARGSSRVTDSARYAAAENASPQYARVTRDERRSRQRSVNSVMAQKGAQASLHVYAQRCARRCATYAPGAQSRYVR